MTEPLWQCHPPDLIADDRLIDAVTAVHEVILTEDFDGDPLINSVLGVECRSFRRIEGWRVMLVLTPWMLARLLIPDRPLDVEVPLEWSADRRRDAGYTVLGPALQIDLLGQSQKVHLNFHPRLGHYLLHPLCLNMQGYDSSDAVFHAWNEVIRTRDENMQRMKKDCPLQQEVSRREFFSRYRT